MIGVVMNTCNVLDERWPGCCPAIQADYAAPYRVTMCSSNIEIEQPAGTRPYRRVCKRGIVVMTKPTTENAGSQTMRNGIPTRVGQPQQPKPQQRPTLTTGHGAATKDGLASLSRPAGMAGK